MCTFRFSSYQIIQFLLIVFVASGAIAKQTPFQCAAFGEYCLNHWDCCSNACLSYLYRCARGHGVYPYPFLGVSYKPAVTLEQILEQNFGDANALPDYEQHDAKPYFASRFGGDDNVAATEIKIVLQKSKQTAGETPTSKKSVDFKEPHLDATTLKTSIELKNRMEPSTPKTAVESEENSTMTTELHLSEEATGAVTEKGLQTTVKRSSDEPSCAEIGEKCYQHEDCCDKLCHGYLHQCVT